MSPRPTLPAILVATALYLCMPLLILCGMLATTALT